MSKGPGLFSSFGQKVQETLYKDYGTEHKVSLSSETAVGGEASFSVFTRSGLSSGDVAARKKYKFATVDARVDMDSNISATFTLIDVLPSTKTTATLKYPEYHASKVDAQYLHEHASLTTSVDLNKNPSVNVSATIGTPLITFGTEAGYKADSHEFTKYSAGFSLAKPNYGVSAILADKGDTVKASCFYHPDQPKKSVVVGEISRKLSKNENTLTVGGSYAPDSHTLVKAKLDNHGQLGTLVQHELTPKSFMTLSGSFDSTDMQKKPRLGLAISLRP